MLKEEIPVNKYEQGQSYVKVGGHDVYSIKKLTVTDVFFVSM